MSIPFFRPQYLTAPNITSVQPTVFCHQVGATVTITGSNFFPNGLPVHPLHNLHRSLLIFCFICYFSFLVFLSFAAIVTLRGQTGGSSVAFVVPASSPYNLNIAFTQITFDVPGSSAGQPFPGKYSQLL